MRPQVGEHCVKDTKEEKALIRKPRPVSLRMHRHCDSSTNCDTVNRDDAFDIILYLATV